MFAPSSGGVAAGLDEEGPPSRASRASRLSRIWTKLVAGPWFISSSAEIIPHLHPIQGWKTFPVCKAEYIKAKLNGILCLLRVKIIVVAP